MTEICINQITGTSQQQLFYPHMYHFYTKSQILKIIALIFTDEFDSYHLKNYYRIIC
jgi:hypothetical protein